MNIISTQYTASRRTLEVYVAGCKGPHCKGCHNAESWDFTVGKPCDEFFFSNMDKKIWLFNNIIRDIAVLGGEPLDQDINKLEGLLCYLASYDKDIWLFTRYDIEEVPVQILPYLDYIKTGRYIPELATDDNIQYGIKLATSNQKIYSRKDNPEYFSTLRNE